MTTTTPRQRNTRHGGAYDRGSADAYYRRPARPHYYTQATYQSVRIGEDQMTPDEIADYYAGYDDAMEFGDHKEWSY